MKISRAISDFIFIKRCACCFEILSRDESEEAFCPKCQMRWMEELVRSCPLCLQSMVECTCMPRVLSETGALTLRKLILYDKSKPSRVQNRMIYFLKNKRNFRVSRFVAQELMPLILAEAAVLDVKNPCEEMFITNIPRGIRSVVRYGHDQSELVCKKLSEISGIPYYSVIKRRIGGKEQKKLTTRQRIKNVRSLFYLNKRLDAELEGKVVLLFDDIVTTGASLAAASEILKGAEVGHIICLSIAMANK